LLSVPDELAVVDALTACLPRVLSELHEDDRDVITCCDLQGMSQAAYAQKIGLSLSAAKSRLQRARVRMKQQMTQACQVQLDDSGQVADFVPRRAGV
jgi:RNA polymerase sigma-70 factor (ECF subfamily)